MASPTLDRTLHFPAPTTSVSRPRPELPAINDPELFDPELRSACGAVRGLVFAVFFQAAFFMLAVLGWEIFRHLR